MSFGLRQRLPDRVWSHPLRVEPVHVHSSIHSVYGTDARLGGFPLAQGASEATSITIPSLTSHSASCLSHGLVAYLTNSVGIPRVRGQGSEAEQVSEATASAPLQASQFSYQGLYRWAHGMPAAWRQTRVGTAQQYPMLGRLAFSNCMLSRSKTRPGAPAAQPATFPAGASCISKDRLWLLQQSLPCACPWSHTGSLRPTAPPVLRHNGRPATAALCMCVSVHMSAKAGMSPS